MGGCFSSPAGRGLGKRVLKKPSVIRKIRKIRGKKKRGVRNHKPAQNAVSGPPSVTDSAEEVWFEPGSLFGSDSEEEYHTVHDGDASPAMLQKRPVAGTQVPICPIGKEMFDSWSPIDPSTFRVRGMNYLRDKKKEHASSKAAYYPFGVDIYISQRKINHIARLVELPAVNSNSKLPALLVVNVQIPLYPPTIFQNENDGEGMNVIMYFKLSERFEKEVPFHFQESIRKLVNNEEEKMKGFQKDTIVPFRERLKILSRVSNVDVLNLNAPQRKLMHAYNEKPILSRPQHEFYSGENYFEIDIDMHRFNYISRKGFDAFQDKLKICILDVGLTIQGNRAEELPEQVLCCLRVNGIDHTNYHQLEPCEDIL